MTIKLKDKLIDALKDANSATIETLSQIKSLDDCEEEDRDSHSGAVDFRATLIKRLELNRAATRAIEDSILAVTEI